MFHIIYEHCVATWYCKSRNIKSTVLADQRAKNSKKKKKKKTMRVCLYIRIVNIRNNVEF